MRGYFLLDVEILAFSGNISGCVDPPINRWDKNHRNEFPGVSFEADAETKALSSVISGTKESVESGN